MDDSPLFVQSANISYLKKRASAILGCINRVITGKQPTSLLQSRQQWLGLNWNKEVVFEYRSSKSGLWKKTPLKNKPKNNQLENITYKVY